MFAVVSLNAPDFLFLSLFSIRRLYPDVEIVVLDNGSHLKFLHTITSLASKFKCTLLYNKCVFKDHVLAIQYLIHLAFTKNVKFLVVLDNDAVLVTRLDYILKEMLDKGAILAGPRDSLRNCPLCVHPSLMIINPLEVIKLGGKYVAFNYISSKFNWYPEPFYSLSYVSLSRILYMDMSVVEKFKPLTLYSFNGCKIAYHAWYGSRVRTTKDVIINGLSTKEINLRHKLIKSFLVNEILST